MSSVKRLVVSVEMADGTMHEELRVRNPALCAYDMERNRLKWPDAREAPMLWQTFVTWRQLVNDGLYAGDFKTFRDVDCSDLEQVKEHEGGEDVDPTLQEDDSTPPS